VSKLAGQRNHHVSTYFVQMHVYMKLRKSCEHYPHQFRRVRALNKCQHGYQQLQKKADEEKESRKKTDGSGREGTGKGFKTKAQAKAKEETVSFRCWFVPRLAFLVVLLRSSVAIHKVGSTRGDCGLGLTIRSGTMRLV
jgi:hypothetical protein